MAIESQPVVGGNRWLERVAERPRPWLSTALAAHGGLLLVVGVVAIGLDISEDGGTPGVLLCAALAIAAYLVEYFAPAPLATACTATIVGAVPAALGFAIIPNLDSYGDVRLIEILLVVLFGALFAIGGTRGRTVFLALALTIGWIFVISEVGELDKTVDQAVSSFGGFGGPFIGSDDIGSSSVDEIPDECFEFDAPESCEDYFGGGVTDEDELADPGDRTVPIGLASTTLGLLYLGGVWINDRSRRRGLATAFVVPGVFALVTGASALGDATGSAIVGGIFIVVAGSVAGWVGGGERRFLTWAGALVATIGVLTVSGDLTTSNAVGESDEATTFGLLTIVFGIAVVAASHVIARLRNEFVFPTAAFGRPSGPETDAPDIGAPVALSPEDAVPGYEPQQPDDEPPAHPGPPE